MPWSKNTLVWHNSDHTRRGGRAESSWNCRNISKLPRWLFTPDFHQRYSLFVVKGCSHSPKVSNAKGMPWGYTTFTSSSSSSLASVWVTVLFSAFSSVAWPFADLLPSTCPVIWATDGGLSPGEADPFSTTSLSVLERGSPVRASDVDSRLFGDSASTAFSVPFCSALAMIGLESPPRLRPVIWRTESPYWEVPSYITRLSVHINAELCSDRAQICWYLLLELSPQSQRLEGKILLERASGHHSIRGLWPINSLLNRARGFASGWLNKLGYSCRSRRDKDLILQQRLMGIVE